MSHMMRFFLVSLVIVLLAIGAVRSSASAQSLSAELPFGGMHIFATKCTCAADSLHYILDYTTNNVIMLLYPPGTKLFSNYNVYATYQLGTYMPGGQQCMMQTGNSCSSIPTTGSYGNQPGTGTSFRAGFRALAGAFAPLWGSDNARGPFFTIRPTILRRSVSK